jgi:hypothetical protein
MLKKLLQQIDSSGYQITKQEKNEELHDEI